MELLLHSLLVITLQVRKQTASTSSVNQLNSRQRLWRTIIAPHYERRYKNVICSSNVLCRKALTGNVVTTVLCRKALTGNVVTTINFFHFPRVTQRTGKIYLNTRDHIMTRICVFGSSRIFVSIYERTFASNTYVFS